MEGEYSVKRSNGLLRELLRLLLKLIAVALLLFVLFGYVFGLTRNLSLNMQSAFRDGDLVLYYRVVDGYAAGEVVVLRYEGQTLLERIVAVAGDTVDITEKGLLVNGSAVQESGIAGETTQFEGGVTFPLKVPEGQVFVLGDNRPHATDSRIFGCVNEADIHGRVMGLFRRRGF